MKVLIAEDTDSVCYALRLAVEYLGHEVIATAADGLEAMKQYVRTRPELVLMDVRMPLLDGLKCTELLARQDPAAKVIIVTAGRTTEGEAREAGACGFMEKPFELNRLEQIIAAAA